jgi:hypothetical protein
MYDGNPIPVRRYAFKKKFRAAHSEVRESFPWARHKKRIRLIPPKNL